MAWYLPWMREGYVCIAAHKFDPRYGFRCTETRNGIPCRMRLHDLLSEADYLQASMPEVSCYGGLGGLEKEDIQKAAKARREAIEKAF
jgi:hypothetical protein